MKPNHTIFCRRLPTLSCQIVAVFILLLNATDAIRVYEGTNIPAPTSKIPKSSSLTKKFLYISKRSWSSIDSIKENQGSDEKLKELYKRTAQNDIPVLYKIKFTNKNYMQHLKYIREVPRLEEYTFCVWYKPSNMTHNHNLFFYSLSKNETLLRFWINAIDSTLRLSIRGSTVYKIPANIREHKWHHICQSWNGVLGELQIFLDGKRIGSGIISHYKGTYIPEGGEVTLGQYPIKFDKIFDYGMVGEMFGFNLVDEAVPQDQGNFINSQYKPNAQAFVPPFKKLPPMKKTYQEIKAYISSLPSEPIPKKNEAFSGEEPSTNKKSKEPYQHLSKRNRGNHRIRYPPLRKVIVYNRDDRQLPLIDGLIELNKTSSTTGKPIRKQPIEELVLADKQETILPLQLYDENYSIHSYRGGKNEKKSANYEIYEAIEDDTVTPIVKDKLTEEDMLARKARQNFNLHTAREAHKVYTLSSSIKDSKKPKFHFESAQSEPSNRRSSVIEEPINKKDIKLEAELTKRRTSETIPVYEIEIAEARRKRSTEERKPKQFSADDPLVDANGFRRLPQIPDSFINIFTQNASTSEVKKKLEEFFPNTESKESNVVAEITEQPKTSPSLTEAIILIELTTNIPDEIKTTQRPAPAINLDTVPNFSPIPIIPIKPHNIEKPVEFSNEQFKYFDPRQALEGLDLSYSLNRQDPSAERRKFDVSSGTDLVMRSYGACTANRGTPARDKQHIIISWADTPVRIFGGAQVERARNECGNF